ncbi:myosin-binding protein 3-like [Tasmannia lanceolata]|uniref:myosin-binding protein 3-like n=1 Tax=Tasmannia lanceolata TaxID=3420 RepID=UPI004062C538
MATNKFATMLHKNTHKITLILVYALLEWILIILLLLNSLFSYLIMKFATFFGLKSPCVWCSRIDHVLEPSKCKNSYRDLICETHANEISRLGYCSNHRKLAESGDMCEDCSSSQPSQGRTDRRIAFFSLVKEMGKISSDGESKIENGENDLKCSCCGVSLNGGFYSPYLLFKPSWDVLDYTQKGNLIKNEVKENCDGFSDDEYLDLLKSECKGEIRDGEWEAENQILSGVSDDKVIEKTEEDYLKRLLSFQSEEIGDDSRMPLEGTVTLPPSDDNEILTQLWVREDSSVQMFSTNLERYSADDRLVPIELIDSMTVKIQTLSKIREDELLDTKSEFQNEIGIVVHTRSILEDKVIVLSTNEREDDTRAIEIGTKGEDESEDDTRSIEIETKGEDESEDDTRSIEFETKGKDECSSLFPAQESNGVLVEEVCDQVATAQETQIAARYGDNIEAALKDYDEPPVSEEDSKMIDAEDKSEIFHENLMDCHQIYEPIPSLECLQKDQSSKDSDAGDCTTCDEVVADQDQGPEPPKELVLEIEPVKMFGQGVNHHLSTSSELNEAEEEKAPETPTYMEGIQTLHKRLLFERKESGTESLDGSAISEIDGCEGVSVDRLKTALKSERRVLTALYAELEEERSASAIAANQTMAMITRLQEEKAAMQMEALQYQRMMEEQSEYDQEALQLLNELMVKREKEKQELEKELEMYRKKVLQYEAKEKRLMRKRNDEGRNKISSCSSSAEDSDELSIDLNERDDSFYSLILDTTPADEVLSLGTRQESAKQLGTLDESLADFEEERLSILEQLKALEERLFTLGDEEEHFEDVKAIENFSEYNGEVTSENFVLFSENENGIANGFSDELDTNGKHHYERRNIASKAKRLLPLFDAISVENEDGLPEEQDPKHAIEEEVDHVYERLQALEADREFLKHCISSLKKGDKGMDLLQEILQHLRDLRTVEFRVKNTSDALS